MYFKQKVSSVLFIRSNFIIVGEKNTFAISQIHNHIRSNKKKKSSFNNLVNLSNSRDKFLGVENERYSIVHFNGQEFRGDCRG